MKLLSLFLISFAFGSTDTFWVWDLTVMPPGFRRPSFTKKETRSFGDGNLQFRLWVEDDLGEHNPNDEALKSLVQALKPDSGKGIFEKLFELFGAPPIPAKGEKDVNILITSLPPYVKNGKKFGFDGFFNVFDQISEPQAQEYKQHSNEQNVVYANALVDMSSTYMHGVLAHELAHLFLFKNFGAKDQELEGWLNELVGESAMIATGYFTDIDHVAAYRTHPEWPIAALGYSIKYGPLASFSEYLIKKYSDQWLKTLEPSSNSFMILENATNKPWKELFASYAAWLFEEENQSGFKKGTIVPTEWSGTTEIAPTALRFFKYDPTLVADEFIITKVPKSCAASENMVRKIKVSRGESTAIATTAVAMWVESSPPCVAESSTDTFVITK
jgi:hypothetical protein